ncbi:MAG: class I SAM-dependent methyltransferase [Segetibacter sp.]
MQAQIFLINAIPANCSILIIGGGTGQILQEISKKHKSGLQITYVEISENMIALSKRKNTGNNKVNFVSRSISDATFHQQFDVVITPFLFDNFSNSTTEIIFDKIDALLAPKGFWLFADFQQNEKNVLWQKFMLKFMYFFFRMFCNVEASHLPDTEWLFEKYNYQVVSMKTFYKDFIYSAIYQKQ